MADREPGWDLWRAFDAAMEARTLSGAARLIGVTQPTLGRQIEALEDGLGFALFVRSQKGLAPTEAALGLAPLAHTMAATADAMLRTAAGGEQEESGVVRITASEVVAVHILPDLIAEFGALYPRIAIELYASNEVDDLLTRQADLAVRMVEPSQQALVARKIGETSVKLYAHRNYLARMGTPEKIEDIRQHRVIGFDTEARAFAPLAESGVEVGRSDFLLRSDNQIVQTALIVAGAGIGGMQPQLAKRYPELVPVLAGAFRMEFGVWVVMHEDLRHAGPTRLLFDFLAERLGDFFRERG
jgi:DNA-binding transcriptional LysR family regulator